MLGSALTHLECGRCGLRHAVDRPQNLCRACSSPLLARYDLERVRRSLDRDALSGRPATLWRYAELLPVIEPERAVSLGEGWTPLLPLARLGAELGLPRLFLKDEGLCPTGTFKARGAAVGVSRARELGIRTIAMPTAGNAGGAWAAYCARAGIRLHVVMPADAPAINQREVLAAGARLALVDGLISDAGQIVGRAVERYGWFDASTLKEPYRIEGKKTLGFEIAEQLGWELPDVVLYPCGGGVGLIGLWKAFDELAAIGWVPAGRRPRLVAVQAAGCAPIVRAWEEGAETATFWREARTLAAGLRVPKPLGDFLVLRALRTTNGTALAVSDAEILAGLERLARLEGVVACPEGAALVPALERLRAAGWLGPDDRVVLLNTGTGLKYPEALPSEAPLLARTDDLTER